MHLDDVVEFLPRQRPIRPRAPHQRERVVLGKILARDHRHQLLREHVQRPVGNARDLEISRAHPAHDRGRLHQLIARDRKEPALGNAASMVGSATDPLQRDREAARGFELHHQIDRAHVDAQLQRRRRHRAAHLAALQFLLGCEPHRPSQRSVVRHHLVLAQPLPQRMRDALDLPARVGEHQRGLVLEHELRDAVVHLLALLFRGHRRQLVARHFDAHVQRPPRAALDDGAGPPAGEKAPDLLDGTLGGRETHPHTPPPTQRVEAFQRKGEVRPALVARYGMDLPLALVSSR